MIAFVQKMDEVDTTGVEPLQHMSYGTNVWRLMKKRKLHAGDALKNAPSITRISFSSQNHPK